MRKNTALGWSGMPGTEEYLPDIHAQDRPKGRKKVMGTKSKYSAFAFALVFLLTVGSVSFLAFISVESRSDDAATPIK
jgi:hypothetical protein